MYDIGEHINNLLNELPEYLNKNDKQLLLETTGIYKQQMGSQSTAKVSTDFSILEEV